MICRATRVRSTLIRATLVVDASVAVQWYVPEPTSEAAARILASGSQLIAPALLAAEFGNALWKKVQRGVLGPEEAVEIARAFVSTEPVSLVSTADLLIGALDIALRYERAVYDALYLALAVSESATFVTADVRLVNTLRHTPLEPVVRALA